MTLFRESCSHIPLFPQPVITRWGTWLDVALYYSEHLHDFQSVVQKMDSKDAKSIAKAKID